MASPDASGCDGYYPSQYLPNPDIAYDIFFPIDASFFVRALSHHTSILRHLWRLILTLASSGSTGKSVLLREQ